MTRATKYAVGLLALVVLLVDLFLVTRLLLHGWPTMVVLSSEGWSELRPAESTWLDASILALLACAHGLVVYAYFRGRSHRRT